MFRHSLRLLAILALLALPTAAAAAPAVAQTGYPITVVDDSGVSATFASPPQRIVSLNPGYTEIMFALGAGARVVAVDTYSDYPPEAAAVKTRLNVYPSPSVEAIVGLKPDLVLSLVESDQTVSQLRQQKIPVLKLFPKDFDATVSTITRLGQVVAAPDRAEAITSGMAARRDAVVAAVADAPRPTVYEELDASDPSKPFVAGPNGFYGQLIDLAGGDNVFGDLPADFGQVGAESVIERNPDVILLTDADLPLNPQTPDLVAARPGWDAIAAVQSGAVHAVNGRLVSTPGPRLIDGLEAIAAVLHPDRFPSGGAAAPRPLALAAP